MLTASDVVDHTLTAAALQSRLTFRNDEIWHRCM